MCLNSLGGSKVDVPQFPPGLKRWCASIPSGAQKLVCLNSLRGSRCDVPQFPLGLTSSCASIPSGAQQLVYLNSLRGSTIDVPQFPPGLKSWCGSIPSGAQKLTCLAEWLASPTNGRSIYTVLRLTHRYKKPLPGTPYKPNFLGWRLCLVLWCSTIQKKAKNLKTNIKIM